MKIIIHNITNFYIALRFIYSFKTFVIASHKQYFITFAVRLWLRQRSFQLPTQAVLKREMYTMFLDFFYFLKLKHFVIAV